MSNFLTLIGTKPWTATESIPSTPEPQVVSTSAKKHTVARIYTSQVSKAPRSLKFKNKHTVSSSQLPPRPRRAIAGNAEVRLQDWTVKKMGGKYPPLNNNFNCMHDPANHRICMYGGSAPGQESNIPTSEFYICDTTTMEWKDSTVRGHIQLSSLLGIYLFLEFPHISRSL